MRGDTSRTEGQWVVRPRPNPQAELRLFCFPYSGASASLFFAWADVLPPSIEVCAIQLPGHGTRVGEPLYTDLDPLVEALCDRLLTQLQRPFAFFGHSMGALASFELARRLRRLHGLAPVHLFASGHGAPQLADRLDHLHALPEPEFWEQLRALNGTPDEVLQHPELKALLLPILRADFRIAETYVYRDEPPLDCPLSAYSGLADAYVTREEVEAWRAQTAAAFSVRLFPGDHFYLNTARHYLVQAIARELIAYARSR